MIKLKNEKGVITVITLVTVLLIISFLTTSYIVTSNKVKTQKEMLNETKAIYEPKVSMEEFYISYTNMEEKLAVKSGYPVTLDNSTGNNLLNYRIYGNSIQDGEPSIEQPVEIQSVGEKTDNLLNINKFNNSRVTVDGNNVNVNVYTGNASQSTGVTLQELCPDIEVGKTYYLYYTSDRINTNFSIGSYSGTNLWANGQARTISEADLTATVRIGCQSGGVINLSNIQVAENQTNVYEDYGKYKIPVKVSGKNLVNLKSLSYPSSYLTIYGDGSGFDMISSVYNNGYSFCMLKEMCPDLKVGDTFVITFETNAIRNDVEVDYVYLSYGALIRKGSKQVCTQEMLDSQLYFYRGVTENAYIKNLQIEIGQSATKYEPYVEPVTTNIYLDEPLRKIGNYADYIDFESGKIVRRISKFIMSNTLTFNATTEDRVLLRGASSKVMKNSNIGMSSIWKYETPTKNSDTAFLYANNGYFYWYPDVTAFGVNFKDDNTTIKDPKLQEWLSAQTEENKTVYYVLATPDDTQIIELPNISTHKGTNIVEVETDVKPSNISVTYNSLQ